ncbi:MAG: DUF5803 family protein [Halobacteria archaeon]|nr:DUF5803 family protein [Halobacteria archaeon]
MRGSAVKVIAVLSLTALVVLAGCMGEPSFGDNVSYEAKWNTTSDITYYIGDQLEYTVVKTNGTQELEVWRNSPLGGEEAARIDGVKFRYPNGTVVNVSSDAVDSGGSRTTIDPPNVTVSGNTNTNENDTGTLAFVSRKSSGTLSTPVPRTGSVRVVLPENTDARNLIRGRISPGEYEIIDESPVTIRWEKLEKGDEVVVRYYHERDPLLLMGLLTILIIAAVIVVLYYRRVFEKLEKRRKREGLEK